MVGSEGNSADVRETNMRYYVNVITWYRVAEGHYNASRKMIYMGSLPEAQALAKALTIPNKTQYKGPDQMGWQECEVLVRVPLHTKNMHSILLPVSQLSDVQDSIKDVLRQIREDTTKDVLGGMPKPPAVFHDNDEDAED